MFFAEPAERHSHWRIFQGLLSELLFAACLEDRSHMIVGLGAWRDTCDIETVSPDGLGYAFELKFIGQQDADFEAMIQSIGGQGNCHWVSPYGAVNYLVFRAYEAARQLLKTTKPHVQRIGVLIIDEVAWWRFEHQLTNGWVDWTQPRFIGDDLAWKEFIEGQKTRYPCLPNDLPTTTGQVGSIWVVKQSSDFAFHLIYDISPEPKRR